MDNLQLAHKYLIDVLKDLSIKYEVHTFDSGAMMIDVWFKDKFYVFQFEENFIGFSEVNENTALDNNPDEKFYDFDSFKQKLTSVVNKL